MKSKIHDYELRDITLEITNKCPLNCLMCSSNAGEEENKEIPLEKLKLIIDQAAILGCREISISGGEPTIFQDIISLCRYIKKKNIEVIIFSSGNFYYNSNIIPIPEPFLNSLKRIQITKMVYSIHGENAKTHDFQTNRVGSYKNLIESIRRSSKYGIKSNLHFVPTKINYSQLPGIIKIAKKFNVKSVNLLRFVPQGRGKINSEVFELSHEEIIRFRKIIKNVSIGYKNLKIGAHFSCLLEDPRTKCTAAKYKATILPDGTMLPCSSMKELLKDNDDRNNIYKESIENIWRNSSSFCFTRNFLQFSDKINWLSGNDDLIYDYSCPTQINRSSFINFGFKTITKIY